MPLVEVGPITYGLTTIPGGWEARVPQIEVVRDDPRFREMVTAFQRFGNRPLRAEDLAQTGCREIFTGRYVTCLRAFVARAALRHLTEGGTMETFRPEVAQRAYIPGLDDHLAPGRGNMLLAEVLREMRT